MTTFSAPRIFCKKLRTLLSSLYVYLTQCAKQLSKQLEANFKHLQGMELTTDVIFLVLLSINNDLFIYVVTTSVGCEVKCAISVGCGGGKYLT